MIGGDFSLFGFDLFGLSRRPPVQPTENDERQTPDRSQDEPDRDRVSDREYSESFLWGMYPVY